MSVGYSRGDIVQCTATSNDGTEDGNNASGSATIENSPPSVSNITISPSAPVYASTLSASYTTGDIDGDSVSVTYAWFVDGAQVSTSPSIPVASYAVKGDTLRVELVPDDSLDTGTAGLSGNVTVRNTAPSDPALELTETPVAGLDELICEIVVESTDVDTADIISYRFSWEADGRPYPDDFGSAVGPTTTTFTDDTIPAQDNTFATTWTCFVSADDGTDLSNEVSDSATVVPP